MAADNQDNNLRCSFCGKPQDEVERLIAGPRVYICDGCVGLCTEVLALGRRHKWSGKKKEGSHPEDPRQVSKVLAPWEGGQGGTLGVILVEFGLISPAQLDVAIDVQREKGGFLGQLLIEMGYIKQDVFIDFLINGLIIPHLNLSNYEISEDVIKLISKETCLKYYMLPIDLLGRSITVAMADPLNTEALSAIMRECPGLRIKPVFCDWPQFKTVSARIFGEEEDKENGDE